MLPLLELMGRESGRQHMLHHIARLNISLMALACFCESQVILLLIIYIWFLYVVFMQCDTIHMTDMKPHGSTIYEDTKLSYLLQIVYRYLILTSLLQSDTKH